MNTAEPIRSEMDIKNLMEVYKKGTKNHLLLAFALNTGLRISDILRSKSGLSCKGIWKDREKKTGKEKTIELNPKLVLMIRDFVAANGLKDNDFLFFSNKNRTKPICRTQAHYIISNAGEMIGLKLSSHSLRKSWGLFAYQNNVDLALLQYIYQHHSQACTLRYIGVNQIQANKVTTTLSIGI